jgi:hypothetical protein
MLSALPPLRVGARNVPSLSVVSTENVLDRKDGLGVLREDDAGYRDECVLRLVPGRPGSDFWLRKYRSLNASDVCVSTDKVWERKQEVGPTARSSMHAGRRVIDVLGART